jgi:hypothetical protein
MTKQLLIPTHRDLNQSKSTFELLIASCKIGKIDVIVSDNSNSSKKHQFLSQLPEEFKITINEECEAITNWNHCLQQSTGTFVQWVNDDDHLIQLSKSNYSFDNVHHSIVAVSPIVLIRSPNIGVAGLRQFELLEADPLDRLNSYRAQAKGANSLLYAAWRRTLYENLRPVITDHPCTAGYQDWTIVRTMLLEGKVLTDPSTLYVYNNDNWFGPSEAIELELKSLFVRAGLNPALTEIMDEIVTLDTLVFFCRKQRYALPLHAALDAFRKLHNFHIHDHGLVRFENVIGQILEKIARIDMIAYDKYLSFTSKNLDQSVYDEFL